MELKINTEIGQLTGVFESAPLMNYETVWIGWFKEKPSMVVQADSVNEAIEELHISLKVQIAYEREIKKQKK